MGNGELGFDAGAHAPGGGVHGDGDAHFGALDVSSGVGTSAAANSHVPPQHVNDRSTHSSIIQAIQLAS